MPRTALITGASVGIGLELARLAAADRCDLVLVARDAVKLEKVAVELRGLGAAAVRVLPFDLAKSEAPQKIADQLSAEVVNIDILINNAGFGVQGYFAQSDGSKQLDLIQVNIAALTHLTHLFLPGMLARKSGRIMNLASVAAFMSGPLMSSYYASKAYVVSFSLAIAEECRGSGVTVTAVCPGPTRTEFFDRAGMADAGMLKSYMMSAADCARIGYKAMMKGKPLVTTGIGNKLLVQATRWAPRMLAARIAHGRNQLRNKKI